MHTFWGITRYEYRMSIRRWGVWLANGLMYLFYGFFLFAEPEGMHLGNIQQMSDIRLWQFAADTMFYYNMFMVLIGGILAADRLQRDERLGVRELQRSTPLPTWAYVLGKYVGALLAGLTPMFLFLLVATCIMIPLYPAPLALFSVMGVVFLSMAVPALAFVTAFSLACPLVMPVRVYQILFTGYWFWGNYLNPEAFPTLNGTLLTPGGHLALDGWYGGFEWERAQDLRYTALDATLNLIVLALCIAAVLITLRQYLAWQARRA